MSILSDLAKLCALGAIPLASTAAKTWKTPAQASAASIREAAGIFPPRANRADLQVIPVSSLHSGGHSSFAVVIKHQPIT